MPFSVQVLCKETSFQSSSFKRHHIHPSCPLLPHDSCKSTDFTKTTFEPKQVDFIRRNYTKAFYCHVDLEQWWVMVWRLHCVTRAPVLNFMRNWVALSLKVVSHWVSESGIGNTCPDLHFVQYIKAWMSSTDPVSSITNCYRLLVPYTDPVHSFIIS